MRVMTVGTWDLLHEGHRNLFHRCRLLTRAGDWGHDAELTDPVFVGVNTDDFVERYKGVRPHQPQELRALNAAKFGPVFYHDDHMIADLVTHRPQLLVVGSDWARKDYLAQIKVTQDELDELDVSVVYVPRTVGVSSTEERERLNR
jgi:glycerol-3-phosphate cytidylyltransferase